MRIRVLGQFVHLQVAMLALAEAALFFCAFVAAGLIRFREADLGGILTDHWIQGILFSVVTMVSLLSLGLYSARQRARVSGILLRVIVALATAIVVTGFLFYLIHDLWVGRGLLAIAGTGAAVGVLFSRFVFSRMVDENLFKRRVLVYGAGRNAAVISNMRRRSDRRGFHVIGFVRPEDEVRAVSSELILEAPDGLVALCIEHEIDEVVVAMEDRRRGFPILPMLECRLAGIDVTELLSFLERETGRVRVDMLNPSWMIFGEGFRRGTLRLLTSRLLDVVASSVICVITLPLMIGTALAIKIEDGRRAPVLYRQRRVGLGGRPFNVLKFRSMRTDAERSGPQWATKHDARVTRVGAFIRKTRIDELPQILCVLRGHMGFVGPRPERPEFVTELSEKIPYYVQRHCVKPGITGWAQLCYPYGSSEQDALEKLQYDLYYIKNNSLMFDLTIILQTVEVVFMGKGAR